MSASKTQVWYARTDYGTEYRHELTVQGRYDLTDKWDRESLIKDCADDYHSNHDGWEAAWPITFALFATEEGPEVARFDVERDVEPVFYARAAPMPDTAPAAHKEAI